MAPTEPSPRRRPRTWRWLVTVTVQPPMPHNMEIWYGFLTKRRADQEARSLRAAFAAASHRTYRLAVVGVRRREVSDADL